MILTGVPPVTGLVLMAGSTTPTSNQPGGQGPEFGSSGPVALIMIIVLFIAAGFLVRSMSRHLKRVPASFDPPSEAAEDEEPKAESKTAPERRES